MDRLKLEDGDEDREDLEYVRYEEKAAEAQKLFGPPAQKWEQDVWHDVKVDQNGQILRAKSGRDGEWEIGDSKSVRERRVLQGQSDWPLSARHEELKKANKRRLKKAIKSD